MPPRLKKLELHVNMKFEELDGLAALAQLEHLRIQMTYMARPSHKAGSGEAAPTGLSMLVPLMLFTTFRDRFSQGFAVCGRLLYTFSSSHSNPK